MLWHFWFHYTSKQKKESLTGLSVIKRITAHLKHWEAHWEVICINLIHWSNHMMQKKMQWNDNHNPLITFSAWQKSHKGWWGADIFSTNNCRFKWATSKNSKEGWRMKKREQRLSAVNNLLKIIRIPHEELESVARKKNVCNAPVDGWMTCSVWAADVLQTLACFQVITNVCFGVD